MAIIKNERRVPRTYLANHLNKIKHNPNNSLSSMNYVFLANDEVDVTFHSTSQGTYRQVLGAIAGSLSKKLGKGFRLR